MLASAAGAASAGRCRPGRWFRQQPWAPQLSRAGGCGGGGGWAAHRDPGRRENKGQRDQAGEETAADGVLQWQTAALRSTGPG